MVKTSKTSIPIAMFVGKHDKAVKLKYAKYTKDLLGDAVILYEEVNGGHNIFSIGKD